MLGGDVTRPRSGAFQWSWSSPGLTFLVDLVVQGDRATAPLDGPAGLLLCARVQGDILPLAFDAAFQLGVKDT